MNKFENEIKTILHDYKITVSKDDNYNQWNHEASLLGKKIGALRKAQKREVIANFLEIIIRWNNLKLDNHNAIILIEYFIGKHYDVRLILNLLSEKIDINKNYQGVVIDFDSLEKQYFSIMEKRIDDFERNFSEIIEKYSTDLYSSSY